MNYLGHAFLSGDDAELLAGNMIGDYVKGKKILEQYPEQVKNGILLHRKIDAYTDTHPASMRAKVWFREVYGMYSGAIIDTIFDHFLANDARYFSSQQELRSFTQGVYKKLEQQKEYFPEKFSHLFPHMQEHDWLYNYRTLQGIQRSLKGLERRAKYIPPIEDAYQILIVSYYQLQQCYYEFIEDVLNFVNKELMR